jgi:hypothetical protein
LPAAVGTALARKAPGRKFAATQTFWLGMARASSLCCRSLTSMLEIAYKGSALNFPGIVIMERVFKTQIEDPPMVFAV